MVELPSKVLIFSAFLCVYIYEIKGRPNNFDDVTEVEDQNKFEESDLLKKSKTNSGGQDKGQKENKGNKKQIIDALHLGPYHHGHPWGTVSQWPGYHWAGHPSRHGGWTGYPSLGGWHKSHISKKNAKKSAHKEDLRRHMLPTFAFPSYGFAYPSLGFAAVPFTPTPFPWGYAAYRSKVPVKSLKGQTRSSVKDSEADKRWWPGYMGGWGGWGLGNGGYPGWGPLSDWGHGYDFGGFGHGWGVGFGNSYHPFLRAEIPGKQTKKDKAQKRWWPGYMGGWGGWNLGNSGYPGWGPLGNDWGPGWGGYGYGHGFGLGHGYGHGFGLGYGYGHGLRSDVPGTEDDKEEEGPKRGFIHQPFGGTGFPWYGYGPFSDYGYPFLGHSQYIPYPEALYGDFMPFNGFSPFAGGPFGYGFLGGRGLFRSKIPSDKSKQEHKQEEKATSRHFVHNFHPGRMGWGGVLYPSHGYRGVFPLLGAHTYGPYGAGYYGPYGPPRGSFGPYYRSNVPKNKEKSTQSRQVINYNPGCYGWGGCIHPGCGFIGGWTWPLPCHHCGCCPCWRRSKAPKKQESKEEKGKSRQEIESPGDGEANEGKSDDPRTRPHLEGADLLNSEMQTLAMGFPGIEKLQTPMGLGGQGGQEAQGFSDPEIESNGEQSSPEQAEAPPNVAAMTGMAPDVGGNDFKPSSLGNMEEQQNGQQQPAEDLMSSFNMGSSSEGEAPVESFGETGNPNMYPNGAEEQTTESASRRADIPGKEEEELAKKQAVAYPYHYYYPGYTMAHGINPYYHYTPINYAQHLMAYPSVYPLAHTGYFPQPFAAYHERPTHSIHVGAPNVNVDVHTTREHVAHSPEKQRKGKLKELVGEFSDKLKFKSKHGQSSHGKKVAKRQLPSIMSPSMSRPIGFAPPLRYPVPDTASLIGRSMYPSLQQSQQYNMNAMSRSGLPAMPPSIIGTSPLGFSGIKAPQMRSALTPSQMRSALTPSQMAFSRQLSSMTGISIPISAQPGMGIVGMAQRKKRSPSKKSSKKHTKTTKRQFLAAIPQAFPTGLLPAFSLPTAPFAGPSSPAFPSFPLAQTQSPMAFKPSTFPTFPAKPAPARLSGMKLDTLGARRMPMLSPFSGFPYAAQNPFVKVPQFQNANFFRDTSSSPWAPVRQSMSGFQQAFERNPEPVVPEMQQSEGPLQMNGEQLAGFNPSSFGLGGAQPSPMFPEEGPGSEGQQAFMGPQKEIASFYQVPEERGMMESPQYTMQPGLAALKKSSVPSKKHHKQKTSKSKRQSTL